MASGNKLSMRDALPIWWRVARQWFSGSSRGQARLYLLLCAVLAGTTTWLAVQISYAQKHFSTGLAEKDKAAWQAAVWEFVGIICLAAPLRALDYYTEKRLIALWRAALTQAFITAYTTNRAYFHLQLARGTEGGQSEAEQAGHEGQGDVTPGATGGFEGLLVGAAAGDVQAGAQQQQQQQQVVELSSIQQAAAGAGGSSAAADAGSSSKLAACCAAGKLGGAAAGHTCVAGLSGASAAVDNPDQRITADVANFVSTSVGLVLLMAKKLLNCAAFAGVLWSISPRLVVFLLGYAFLGTAGTAVLFGRPLTSLQQKVLKLEADLRFGLVRLRENAEAIAFYGGDVHEAAHLSERLACMLVVLLRRISWLGLYELWVTAYSYATILIPSLVLAPEYFSGKIEFGTLTQASYAFSVLEGALGLLLAKLDEFSSLAAETARLAGLLAALEAADIDAGGSGAVQGFARRSGSVGGGFGSGLGVLGALWGWFGRKRKGQDKSEAGAADGGEGGTGDGDDAGESTRLLVTENDRGLNGRRVSTGSTLVGSDGSSGANGQQQRGRGSSSSGVVSHGSAGVRVSRVLRLMDGSVSGFSVEDLSAFVPGRHHQPMCVCTGLSFTIAPGESLLVFGASGCGKSSLLRVIAGLWTVGSGTIRGPHPQHTFFLPQKPFMPLGSLRQQLMFPDSWSSSSSSTPTAAVAAGSDWGKAAKQPEQRQLMLSSAADEGPDHGNSSSSSSKANGADTAAAAAAAVPSTTISIGSSCSADHQLKQLVHAVRLGHLLDRFESGLAAEVDWASVLSLGEQQRVALVRLLYHKPSLAFLDEATSALDPKTESVAYELVRQACASYVSVGHRQQLLEFHTHVLVFGGAPGCWFKYTVQEYKQRLAAGLEG